MKLFFTIGFLFTLCLSSTAQTFNFALTGNPVNTTGWTLSSQSSVQNDAIQLTASLNNQAGYIYFDSAQNLANCSQFTVSFDFKISNSSSPTADGITFFYITSPPSGFIAGGGIGLPSNPNGLVTILDTYNNDNISNNPLVSLRRFVGTGDYVEGSTTGQLTPDAGNQFFITDGNWHTCVIHYSFGTVTVSFDNNPPLMTGTTTLSLNGYFGFSASTGGSYATQSIKNVSIQGAAEPNPPITDTTVYCQNDTAVPLTATGNNLIWYENATGGTALAAAPTPITAIPGTYTWYVSSEVIGCNIESARSPKTVIVHPTPAFPVISIPTFCNGLNAAPITIVSGTNILWYPDAVGGVGSATQPVINTTVPDSTSFFVTQTDSNGCESNRKEAKIIVHQTPITDFTFTTGYNCSGVDSIFFQNNSQFATNYLWNFNDGTSSVFTSPTHLFSPGTYSVLLTSSTQFCTSSTAKPVVIGHPLIASFTSSMDTVCVGQTVDFSNTSTATTINGIDPSYIWIFGTDTVVSTTQNQSYLFHNPGVFDIVLIAKNSIPCFDTSILKITVDPLPTLSFTGTDSLFCKGDKIILTALNSTDGLENLSWNFGDTNDSVLNTNPIQHAYENAGNFIVTLKANYRICPDLEVQMNILVHDLPVINLGSDTSICLNGSPVILSDNINRDNPIAKWLWNTGDTTSFLAVKHDGIYYAKVTIDGCSAKDEVVVKKDCFLDIPNSFTPNSDGENDYFFPRQFLSSGVLGFSMTVFNRWGQVVFKTNIANGRGWDGKFNEKDQPVGVYVYEINVLLTNGRQENYTGNVTLLR